MLEMGFFEDVQVRRIQLESIVFLLDPELRNLEVSRWGTPTMSSDTV
jgi:hypothetical protein